MSGSKINDFSIGDSNIQSVMLTLDKTFKGLHQVSLTNYGSTSESQIAAGSVVECGGALYKFDSNESITGSPSDGTVYIRLVPDGDSITAEYTNTAPTWSDSKQGWYGTGTDVNKRYLEFAISKDSTLWSKFLIGESRNIFNNNILKVRNSASQNISGGVITKVILDTEIFNYNSNYSTVNSKFTASVSGYYNLSGKGVCLFGTATSVSLAYWINGSPSLPLTYNILDATLDGFLRFSTNIFLSSGDYVEIYAYSSGTFSAQGEEFYLSIFKI